MISSNVILEKLSLKHEDWLPMMKACRWSALRERTSVMANTRDATNQDTSRSSNSSLAGLDLARRRDHSALVLLDVQADRLTVTAALRLPQAPLGQQFALIAPHLAGLDVLVSL